MSPQALLSGAGAASTSGRQGTRVPLEGEVQPPVKAPTSLSPGLTPWPVCGASRELSRGSGGALFPSPVAAGRGVLEAPGTGDGGRERRKPRKREVEPPWPFPQQPDCKSFLPAAEKTRTGKPREGEEDREKDEKGQCGERHRDTQRGAQRPRWEPMSQRQKQKRDMETERHRVKREPGMTEKMPLHSPTNGSSGDPPWPGLHTPGHRATDTHGPGEADPPAGPSRSHRDTKGQAEPLQTHASPGHSRKPRGQATFPPPPPELERAKKPQGISGDLPKGREAGGGRLPAGLDLG